MSFVDFLAHIKFKRQIQRDIEQRQSLPEHFGHQGQMNLSDEALFANRELMTDPPIRAARSNP